MIKSKAKYLVKFYIPTSLIDKDTDVYKSLLFIKENLWKYFDEKVEIMKDKSSEHPESIDKNQFKTWVFKVSVNDLEELEGALKNLLEDFKKQFPNIPLYTFLTKEENLDQFYNQITQRLKLIEGEKLLYFPKYKTFYIKG